MSKKKNPLLDDLQNAARQANQTQIQPPEVVSVIESEVLIQSIPVQEILPENEDKHPLPAGKEVEILAATFEVTDTEKFLKKVREWERNVGEGDNKIKLDSNVKQVLALIKATTGISANQLVNYVMTEFLKSNPSLLTYVQRKTEKNPFPS